MKTRLDASTSSPKPRTWRVRAATIAARGTVFDRAHSTSGWMAPATASIMTGVRSRRHGVVEGFSAHQQRQSPGTRDGRAVQPSRRLPKEIPVLDEVASRPELHAKNGERSLAPLLTADRTEPSSDDFDARGLLLHRPKMGRSCGVHWWASMHDVWRPIVDGDGRSLYDQRGDRRETTDRAGTEPDRVRALSERLDALRAGGIRREGERTEITLDEEMVDALEALGYVDASDSGSAEDAAHG